MVSCRYAGYQLFSNIFHSVRKVHNKSVLKNKRDIGLIEHGGPTKIRSQIAVDVPM